VHSHKDEYRLDTRRFFLIGMSAGGHMVALAAILGDGRFPRTGGWEDQPNTFTTAISSSGAYDLCRLDWGSGWMPPGEPEADVLPQAGGSNATLMHREGQGERPRDAYASFTAAMIS